MKEPVKLSLKKEIEREAGEIKRRIGEHAEFENIEVTDAMDAALLGRIQIYEQKKGEEKDVQRESGHEKCSSKVSSEMERAPSHIRKKRLRLVCVDRGSCFSVGNWNQ